MSEWTISSTGSITTPKGFVSGVASTGMKSGGAFDVTLIVSEYDCAAAGLFTTNQVKAAPVIIDQALLAQDATRLRGVIANAKCANACTGEEGLRAARLTQEHAALLLNCEAEQLFVLSTGVIGTQLPLLKIGAGIAISAMNLGDHGADSAKAIMTTDTVSKHLAVYLKIGEQQVVFGGIAKGAGMIHPNMATMLSVLTTDAKISAESLQQALATAANLSFNRISIDGDTSTNDTVLLLANGASGVEINEENFSDFQAALNVLCSELSKKIVRDGEGATKFVEITVRGSADDRSAHQIANTIAISPLVKTALAGNDPNWGRILAAAGRAGVAFNQYESQLSIHSPKHASLQLLANGTPTKYSEVDAVAIFTEAEIFIDLTVGSGTGSSTVWTCDLTHEYVSINGDYRS